MKGRLMKMKKNNQKNLCIAVGLLAAFALWTVAVCYVDVAPIGPRGSAVGFASVNGFVHRLFGVHMSLYTITDWLGLVPVGVGMGFALLGLVHWFKRRRLDRVDYTLFVLGGFYIVVLAVYLLFETVVINYRPVLIGGYLEASYPSSTTTLVLCVMPTAMMQLHTRIKHRALQRGVTIIITAFMVFMVVGRLISGVHWLTDIVGGALLSAGLVMLYRWVSCLKE
jgi:undecaprenyl-diphosphatase